MWWWWQQPPRQISWSFVTTVSISQSSVFRINCLGVKFKLKIILGRTSFFLPIIKSSEKIYILAEPAWIFNLPPIFSKGGLKNWQWWNWFMTKSLNPFVYKKSPQKLIVLSNEEFPYFAGGDGCRVRNNGQCSPDQFKCKNENKNQILSINDFNKEREKCIPLYYRCDGRCSN